MPSVNETVAVSPLPSAFGVITLGLATRFVSENVAGGGGGPAPGTPSVPVATLIPGALIVHEYPPLAPVESHVQSTRAPRPVPVATGLPSLSTTVTVHASEEESRAWNRIGPPSEPITVGEYSFGSPISATRCASPGNSA